MDGAYYDELWLPRSAGRFLQTENHFALLCGQIDFEIVIPDGSQGFLMRVIAEKQASIFAISGFQLYVFYSFAKKYSLIDALQMEHVTILKFSGYFEHGHMQQTGPG